METGRLVARLAIKFVKLRRAFCRWQGETTSSDRLHASRSNAVSDRKDKQIRESNCETGH